MQTRAFTMNSLPSRCHAVETPCFDAKGTGAIYRFQHGEEGTP